MIRVFVDRLDFGPCKHENPQAEARATPPKHRRSCVIFI
jgi:hypothetical protein